MFGSLAQYLVTTLSNKAKREGIEVSAHAILRPNKDGRTAALLLTMGAAIRAEHVVALLKILSREASKDPANRGLFYFDVPSGAQNSDGKPQQYRVHYDFLDFAYKGQTLDAALRTGEFSSMELVGSENQKFDSGGNLQITERTLKIQSELPKTVTGAAIRNAMRLFKKQPDGAMYDRFRIHYKTMAGKSSSATLPINDLDTAFTLKELIEFDVDVDGQQINLSTTILDGMRPLLRSVPDQDAS